MRRSLKDPPETLTGIGAGKLAGIGPLILGHRLDTRETLGAYQTLIYNKDALVLRMLHFLFTDPSTGSDKAFREMMSDFVRQHKDGWASTESFQAVVNEHFVRTPIAQKYGMRDLNWFFFEWVYDAHLPSYRLEYQLENQRDGSVIVKGTVLQENVPDDFFMLLPLHFSFGRAQSARTTVHALGPQTPFAMKLPKSPDKVELDPDEWVLWEKTETNRR